MRIAKIELQALTPLFMAGSEWEDISDEGLRSPSIRGELRWWYRAILGGRNSSIPIIKEEEANVFGTTEMKSRVIVRSYMQKPGNPIEYPQNGFGQPIDYLFFSMKRTKQARVRLYYEPGAKFIIEILSKDITALKKAVCALWLATNLGGFGGRARRGAGSCGVLRFSLDGNPQVDLNDQKLEFVVTAKEPEKYISYLRNNLAGLTRYIFSQVPQAMTSKHAPEFASLSVEFARIFIESGSYRSWREVLEKVGGWFHEFRRSLADQTLSNGIAFGNLHQRITFQEKRVYFGLPMNYFFRRGGISATLIAKDYKRRASPLWIGVSRGSEGKHFGRVCLFRSEFLPNFQGELGVAIGKNGTQPQPQPQQIKIDPDYESVFQRAETSLTGRGWVNVKW